MSPFPAVNFGADSLAPPWARYSGFLSLVVSPRSWNWIRLCFIFKLLMGPAGWQTISLSLCTHDLNCWWARNGAFEQWGETAVLWDSLATGDTIPLHLLFDRAAGVPLAVASALWQLCTWSWKAQKSLLLPGSSARLYPWAFNSNITCG